MENFQVPIYFLTFRTYGTWLHGDLKGSIDREHNAYGEPVLPHQPIRRSKSKSRLVAPPFTMNKEQRECVESALIEKSKINCWHINALKVLHDHVHIVISGEGTPERIMIQLKAYATKDLREASMVNAAQKIWARHGSTRYLWNEHHLRRACDYLLFNQGKHEFQRD